MRKNLLALLFWLPLSASAGGTGQICIAPVDAKPASKAVELGYVTSSNPYDFEIRISGVGVFKPDLKSPTDTGLIPLRTTRTIAIFNSGKPFASFKTKYPDAEYPRMCLLFRSVYQTWLFTSAAGQGNKCRCSAHER